MPPPTKPSGILGAEMPSAKVPLTDEEVARGEGRRESREMEIELQGAGELPVGER